MSKHHEEVEKLLREIAHNTERTALDCNFIALSIRQSNILLQQILDIETANMGFLSQIEINTRPPNVVTGFTPIKEISMVTLSAGNTATFATTPIPSTSVPVPASLVWSSSDTVNAPVVTNPADATGLSGNVTFPSTVVAGVNFTLTLSYTNTDGTLASQSNTFTTVAPPSPDVTGFTPILQTA